MNVVTPLVAAGLVVGAALAPHAIAVVDPPRVDALVAAVHHAFVTDDVEGSVASARALALEGIRVRHLARADDAVERTLRFLAGALHMRGAERHDAAQQAREWDAALAVYELYLAQPSLAASPHAHELRFSYAELLFRLERFADAARAYAEVAASDGRWRDAAAEEAVRAWDEQRRLTAAPMSRGVGVRAYTEAERELLAACVRYLTELPGGKLGDECAWREAKLRYDVGHLDEAVLRFERFIAGRRASARLEQAIALVMDTHAVREDYTALSAFIARVRADDDLMRRREVRELVGG